MTSRYDRIASRSFITSDDIRTAHARGDGQFVLRDNCTVTDEAREVAMKLGFRLEAAGGQSAAIPSAKPAATPTPASAAPAAAAPAMKTLPEDTARRVADAIASVLAELQLGARAATLAPVLTRRVFAGLTRDAQGK